MSFVDNSLWTAGIGLQAVLLFFLIRRRLAHEVASSDGVAYCYAGLSVQWVPNFVRASVVIARSASIRTKKYPLLC